MFSDGLPHAELPHPSESSLAYQICGISGHSASRVDINTGIVTDRA